MLRHTKIPGGIAQSELRHTTRSLQPAPDSTGVASEILKKMGAAAGSPAASSGVCFWFLAFGLKQCESVSSAVRFCCSPCLRVSVVDLVVYARPAKVA